MTCLAGFYYQDALARAAELDQHLQTSGKPVGPLHGEFYIAFRISNANLYVLGPRFADQRQGELHVVSQRQCSTCRTDECLSIE